MRAVQGEAGAASKPRAVVASTGLRYAQGNRDDPVPLGRSTPSGAVFFKIALRKLLGAAVFSETRHWMLWETVAL